MHYPVLLEEVIGYLAPKSGDIMLDATLGGGGHAIEILKRIIPGGRLVGIDKDSEAIARARQRLDGFKDAVTFINDDFRNVEKIFKRAKIEDLDGAIFDLGLSSFQLDDCRRGFSFSKNGPLDMRFDTEARLSAGDVVNKFGKDKIRDIIKEYGEERYARLIVEEIMGARKKKQIRTTDELKNIILKAVGRKYYRQKIHPACRTFQALRIYVNDELTAVEEALGRTISFLQGGARICVISFHSLEDRVVKHVFRKMEKAGVLAIIIKKPLSPTTEEVLANPRSRSAKLRVAEKKHETV